MKKLIASLIVLSLGASAFAANVMNCPSQAPVTPPSGWTKVAGPITQTGALSSITILPSGQGACAYEFQGIPTGFPYIVTAAQVSPATLANWTGNDQGGYHCKSNDPTLCEMTVKT